VKSVGAVGALLCFSATCLYADFSYEQTSKVTGGMAAGAMKFASVFSKKAQEPIRTSVFVKGDRMAHVSSDRVQVIDLEKETIAEIDLQKKTYSVVTFAEMSQALERMAEKARGAKGAEKVDVKIEASVKETGQEKEIAGLKTREVILTMKMEGTDQESGGQGSMVVTSDMWLASQVAGYDEVKDFYRRMAQKIDWAPGSSALAQGRSDMAKALADLYKESAKLDGVPVLQVVKIDFAGSGQAEAGAGSAESSEKPSITGALGRLGGFGGFGRKKKPAEEKKVEQTETQQASGTLMELTTESSGFSTASVDAARFEAPAGFRKVESEVLKELRK
jgi:hypothetical protein